MASDVAARGESTAGSAESAKNWWACLISQTLKEPDRGRAALDGALAGIDLHDAAILQRHQQAVLRYCRSRTPTLEDAEDALQDTFIRFLERRERDLVNPLAWLIHAAACACADLARRNRLRSQTAAGERPAFEEDTSAEDVVLTRALVGQLMRTLRPRDAAILQHLYVDGVAIDDVARSMGLKAGNVRQLAMRARRRARSLLEHMGMAAFLALPGWAQDRIIFGRHGDPGGSPALAGGGLALVSGGSLVALGIAAALVFVPPAPVGPPARHGGTTSIQATLPGPGGARPQPVPGAGGSQATAPVRAGSSSAVAGLPLPIHLPTNDAAAPDNTDYTSFAAGPAYPNDGVLFAEGQQRFGCSTAPCAVVLTSSTDAGRSWKTLSVGKLQPGQVLLSPYYDSDGMVFNLSDTGGLGVSHDRGETFTTKFVSARYGAVLLSDQGHPWVAFVTGEAALAPSSLLYYDAETDGLPKEGPVLDSSPQGSSLHPQGILPGDAPDTVFVFGMMYSAAQNPLGPGLTTCKLTAAFCSPTQPFSNDGDSNVFGNQPWHDPAAVVLHTGRSVDISMDGAVTFKPRTPPAIGLSEQLQPTSLFRDFRQLLAGIPPIDTGPYLLVTLEDTGAALVPESTVASPDHLLTWILLPDGTILASRNDPGHVGLICSHSGGRSWEPTC